MGYEILLRVTDNFNVSFYRVIIIMQVLVLMKMLLVYSTGAELCCAECGAGWSYVCQCFLQKECGFW